MKLVTFLLSSAAITLAVMGCGRGGDAVPEGADETQHEAAGIAITTVGPLHNGSIVLGEPVNVDYEVNGTFESAQMEIRNRSGTLIYSARVPCDPGKHTAAWDTKWNTGEHVGAYANPARGPYQIKIIGRKPETEGGTQCESQARLLGTLLALHVTLEDPKPSNDEISSGLYPPAVGIGGAPGERIRMGLLAPTGERIWPSEDCPATFSEIVMEDLDNDPTTGDEQGREVASARVSQEMRETMAPLADGTYRIIVDRVRDLSGNMGLEGCPDGVFTDEDVSLY